MGGSGKHGCYYRAVPLSTGKQEEWGNNCSSPTFPYLLKVIIKFIVNQGCGHISSYLGNPVPAFMGLLQHCAFLDSPEKCLLVNGVNFASGKL